MVSVCVPSTVELSTAVIVIVCGVFQFDDVNVRVESEMVTLEFVEDSVSTTSFVGSESSCIS